MLAELGMDRRKDHFLHKLRVLHLQSGQRQCAVTVLPARGRHLQDYISPTPRRQDRPAVNGEGSLRNRQLLSYL